MLQTDVIHVARLDVLDSSGHGDARNLFPFFLTLDRFNLHRMHEIESSTRSTTMSLVACLAKKPRVSADTIACSSEM